MSGIADSNATSVSNVLRGSQNLFIVSTSKDEIVSLVEAAQEKERSSGEHKAEMAFNLMDR